MAFTGPPANPTAVPCPTCGAQPGQLCTNPLTGRPYQSRQAHPTRTQESKEQR
jgi:hypothetical protein